jgi:hypothetical protein
MGSGNFIVPSPTPQPTPPPTQTPTPPPTQTPTPPPTLIPTFESTTGSTPTVSKDVTLPPTIIRQSNPGDRSISPESIVDTDCERHHHGGVCVFACVDTTIVIVGDQKYESTFEYETDCPDETE